MTGINFSSLNNVALRYFETFDMAMFTFRFTINYNYSSDIFKSLLYS